MAQKFEWSADKAQKNFHKHDVSFEEGCTVFEDPLFITVVDDEHSAHEVRNITIGFSNRGRLLLVAHTERASHMRIISVRKATGREEQFYAETN